MAIKNRNSKKAVTRAGTGRKTQSGVVSRASAGVGRKSGGKKP